MSYSETIEIPTFGMEALFGNVAAEEITPIEISRIDPFPNHAFPVAEDDGMIDLMESIQKFGQLEPVIVREMIPGHYQMLSGHRRMNACRKLGYKTMRAITVYDITDKVAEVIMLESNLKRDNLQPSVIASVYKSKNDLYEKLTKNDMGRLKDQFGPCMETEDQVGPQTKYEALSIMAQRTDDSKTQIKRYLRLADMHSCLQTFVDQGMIGFSTATEYLFKLDYTEQELLAEAVSQLKIFPNIRQARNLVISSEKTGLDKNTICDILSKKEEQKNDYNERQIIKHLMELVPEGTSFGLILEEFRRYILAKYKDNVTMITSDMEINI